jgi:hypothetical protein
MHEKSHNEDQLLMARKLKRGRKHGGTERVTEVVNMIKVHYMIYRYITMKPPSLYILQLICANKNVKNMCLKRFSFYSQLRKFIDNESYQEVAQC